MKFIIGFFSVLISFQALSFDYEQFAEKNFRKLDNTITVQIIRSTYPLDWSSSRSLLWSIFKNKYWFPKTRSTIGHVTTEVNCTIGENKVRLFSGQAVENLMDFQTKIREGYGFSILNSPEQYQELPLVTVPGRLNSLAEMKVKFDRQESRGNLNIVSFKVNREQCLSSYLFIREYIRKTQNTPAAGNIYGFGASANKFQGAGCAPFVQTVLSRAELSEVSQQMLQTIAVPEPIVGNPKHEKKVELSALLLNDYPLDGSYSGQVVSFSFPDPEKLYEYMTKNLNSNSKLASKKLSGENNWYLLLDRELKEKPDVDSEASL